MKNIVVFTNLLNGLRAFRFELMQKMREEGYNVSIYCPEHNDLEDFERIGCTVRFVKNLSRRGTNVVRDLKLLSEYKHILKNEKPDVVLTYTIKPNIYGGIACEIMGVPYIANITGLGTAVENGGIMQKITVFLYKLAFMKIKKVFFQNTENMQFFVDKKIALKKHGLLPGSGVNLEKFSYIDYPQKDKTEFAFISRIMKEKGIDQYLETAEIIKEKYPDTVFHVCGSCEEAYEERLTELQEKGVIVYHGMVKDVRTVIKDMHCIIHPTYYPEGMSNVLLEASACGRPIITTNRSGCREVIDEGINGFIAQQKNSEDLTEKIERFLELPYEEKRQMGIAGRKKVEKDFDRQIVVDKYIEELRTIPSKEEIYERV